MSIQVSLKNDGDTPMLFSVTQDASGVFTVLPRQGVVPRGASVLLAVRFAPPKVESYHKLAQLVLNTGAAPVPIELHGAGCKASLLMEHGGTHWDASRTGASSHPRSPTAHAAPPSTGTLHLPTTCVGSASTATLKLTNPSRMAVAYEWDIPAKLEATLMVDLPSGVLRGHESVTLTWQFAPDKDDQYLMKVRPLPPAPPP